MISVSIVNWHEYGVWVFKVFQMPLIDLYIFFRCSALFFCYTYTFFKLLFNLLTHLSCNFLIFNLLILLSCNYLIFNLLIHLSCNYLIFILTAGYCYLFIFTEIITRCTFKEALATILTNKIICFK